MAVGEEGEEEAGRDLEISLPLHHCELLAACLKGQHVNWRCIVTQSMSHGGQGVMQNQNGGGGGGSSKTNTMSGGGVIWCLGPPSSHPPPPPQTQRLELCLYIVSVQNSKENLVEHMKYTCRHPESV